MEWYVLFADEIKPKLFDAMNDFRISDPQVKFHSPVPDGYLFLKLKREES